MKMTRDLRLGAIALSVAAALVLSACDHKTEGPTQVAAKVNGDEITVSQINFALQQQRNVRPDQIDAASKQLLEKLIDQQIAVQQAEKLKLDRDPQTVQMIEAARREIIARRYVESLAEAAAKPGPAEVEKYFNSQPVLFADRKIYTFNRTDIQVPPARVSEVVSHIQAAREVGEFNDWLKSQNIKFSSSAITQPAEALPMQLLDRIGAMKPGTSIALPQQFGVSALTLVSAEASPKTIEEARGAIQQFLGTQARRDVVANAMKDVRASAKIEYEGKFAASAPGAGGAASEVSTSAAAASIPVVATPAASGMDASTLHKGLGLNQ